MLQMVHHNVLKLWVLWVFSRYFILSLWIKMANSGGRFLKNAWRAPEDVFGPGEKALKTQIQEQTLPYDISRDLWNVGCSVVDDVLNILVEELDQQAAQNYKGLVIDKKFVRQASARQGLKIISPDEFDIVIPFRFEGLQLQEVKLTGTDGNLIPGQMRIRVTNDKELDKIVPKLKSLHVFRVDQGTCLIDTMNLQDKVFKSLVDKTIDVKKAALGTKGYELSRGSRPPTINLKIKLLNPVPGLKTIDVDVVPGLILGEEVVEIPATVTTHPGAIKHMFPRFGLMKWVNRDNPNIRATDKELIWRNCSSAYERYMFDLCLGKRERLYLVTSCRVMKVVVLTLQKRQNHAANLLTSYHLKTITLYSIQLLTVPGVVKSATITLSGVKEALGYFLRFLEIAIEEKNLPEFFLGNDFLHYIFPGSYFSNIHKKYNLFSKENQGTLDAAKDCFPEFKKILGDCCSFEGINEKVIHCYKSRIINN